jgi:protein-arginine kinase
LFQAVGDSVKKESGKDFMLDAKYGFIHACPTNLGTGTFTPRVF